MKWTDCMFKVLVVDDEPISVKSVVYMIEKGFDNAEVVATSRSGKDSIEKALSYSPDVVIMDIKMQGINGLEAVKQIQKNRPNTSFVILSAFDYFDYALEAMSLGVEDYLVKPVKEARFNETLTNVFNKHVIKAEERKLVLEQQERLEMVIPILETGFINSLCMSGDGSNELENYARILGYEKTGGYVIVVEFGEKKNNRIENKIGAGVQGEKWHDEFRRILKSLCNCIVGPIMLNRMIIYVFNRETSIAYEQKTESLEVAQSFIKRTRHFYQDINIGISNWKEQVSDANRSYHEALRALHILSVHNERFEEADQILHVDDIFENECDDDYDWNEQSKRIFAEIEHHNESGVLEVFGEFYFSLTGKGCDLNVIVNLMIDLVVGVGKRWSIVLTDSSEVLQKIVKTKNIDSLKMIMENWLVYAAHLINQERRSRVNSTIKKANQYIVENYAKQIQLKDIAEAVNLSTYYFSRFYKEETGMNFSDKLLNVRIDEAKELLKNKELSVKDVSYMVGYLEPAYFSKLFKKNTGYTAGEYKRMLYHN